MGSNAGALEPVHVGLRYYSSNWLMLFLNGVLTLN